MRRSRDNISEREWIDLKDAVSEVAKAGSFNANDALFHVFNTGVGHHAGDVAMILDDLTDLGYLRALAGDPPRWELAGRK